MQSSLAIQDIKTYSRKEVIAWVQSSCSYRFDDLKNGLFFLRILKKLVKSQFGKHKIYENAKNDYEYTHNLNIVKRILNRYNMQLNMNVSEIVRAKNCFQLANWFKNLYDRNKEQADDQFHYSMKSFTPSKIGSVSYKSPAHKTTSRATSSDVKKGKIKPVMQISGNNQMYLPNKSQQSFYGNRLGSPSQFFNRNLSSNIFEKNEIGEYSSGKKIHLRKDSRSLAAKKKENLFMNKTSIYIPTNELQEEDQQNKPTGVKYKGIQQKIEDQTSNILTHQFQILLKKEALKDSITSFQKILDKLAGYISSTEGEKIEIEEFQKMIRKIIYMKG